MFSQEQYFDSHGLFISVVYSGPLLFNCFLMTVSFFIHFVMQSSLTIKAIISLVSNLTQCLFEHSTTACPSCWCYCSKVDSNLTEPECLLTSYRLSNNNIIVPYVGWVCWWFSPVLQEVILQVLWFSPLLKNQHFQISIRSGMHRYISLSS